MGGSLGSEVAQRKNLRRLPNHRPRQESPDRGNNGTQASRAGGQHAGPAPAGKKNIFVVDARGARNHRRAKVRGASWTGKGENTFELRPGLPAGQRDEIHGPARNPRRTEKRGAGRQRHLDVAAGKEGIRALRKGGGEHFHQIRMTRRGTVFPCVGKNSPQIKAAVSLPADSLAKLPRIYRYP